MQQLIQEQLAVETCRKVCLCNKQQELHFTIFCKLICLNKTTECAYAKELNCFSLVLSNLLLVVDLISCDANNRTILCMLKRDKQTQGETVILLFFMPLCCFTGIKMQKENRKRGRL
jgi:hypothetical protein